MLWPCRCVGENKPDTLPDKRGTSSGKKPNRRLNNGTLLDVEPPTVDGPEACPLARDMILCADAWLHVTSTMNKRDSFNSIVPRHVVSQLRMLTLLPGKSESLCLQQTINFQFKRDAAVKWNAQHRGSKIEASKTTQSTACGMRWAKRRNFFVLTNTSSMTLLRGAMRCMTGLKMDVLLSHAASKGQNVLFTTNALATEIMHLRKQNLYFRFFIQ